MSLKLYRPNPEGGLEPAPVEAKDYRRQLRSRRGSAAKLENPEARTTDPWIAVLFILILCAATFGALVIGYSVGFWS